MWKKIGLTRGTACFAPQLPEHIEWHFVGALQTNKCKTIAGRLRLLV